MRPAVTPERAVYLLDYGCPRLSADCRGVIYERDRIRAMHPGDEWPIRWAREIVP